VRIVSQGGSRSCRSGERRRSPPSTGRTARRLAPLDTSTATDLHQVADVIKTYVGSVRALSDPEFDEALQEGLDLIAGIKKSSQE
jgi:hypothetical protein